MKGQVDRVGEYFIGGIQRRNTPVVVTVQTVSLVYGACIVCGYRIRQHNFTLLLYQRCGIT